MLLDVVLWVAFASNWAFGQTEAITSDLTYVAAVYEHRVILNPDPHIPLSRLDALQHMRKNLAVFEEQADLAARQGAQIIVFPEDGLHGFNFSRSSISGYLETIPDPEKEKWNPCTESEKFNNTEVQQQLSCMARRHNLYVVANMGDVQPCPLQTDPTSSCPTDGRWQFNTNVVFRSDGLLVARYHKQNLYFEDAFDTPPQPEIISFETTFAGRFGLITCFDILFYEPKVTLLEMGVRQLIFPTAWMNQLPLLDTIQFQRAFSLGSHVTLLAANIRSDRLIMTGSGIYTPFAATYHHAQSGDPEEGRLLVARIPVLGVATEYGQVQRIAADLSYCHHDDCPSDPTPSSTITSTMMHDPFKFVLLANTEGNLKVCDGAFCCRLQFKRSPKSNSDELYALGAFAGTHTVNGRYAVQVCAVVRCAGPEASSCGQEIEEAETTFDFVLEGEFGTNYVYPSVLVSRYILEQPERVEKSTGGWVTMKHSNTEGGLVTACLYGRVYHLDNK
ncbi:biotinidase isoform X1 [Hippocampus comes]|uniref:Biotinidase n=1 Tax=Hippocampus comes TaxID=109280 RepID=A0A3Q2Y316_HIPCM|nr:PREDICTED: biotinidase isoform X1 [Hippocampus comes]